MEKKGKHNQQIPYRYSSHRQRTGEGLTGFSSPQSIRSTKSCKTKTVARCGYPTLSRTAFHAVRERIGYDKPENIHAAETSTAENTESPQFGEC